MIWYATLIESVEIGFIGTLLMFFCFALISYNRIFGLQICNFRSVMLPSFEYEKKSTIIKNFIELPLAPTIPSAFVPWDEIEEVIDEEVDPSRLPILTKEEVEFLKRAESVDIWKLNYGPLKETDPFATVFDAKKADLGLKNTTATTNNDVTTNTVDGIKRKGKGTEQTMEYNTGGAM